MWPQASQSFSCAQPPTDRHYIKTKKKARRISGPFLHHHEWFASMIHGFDDIVGHFLRIAQKHHRAVLVEQRVVDASIA